MHTPEIEQHAGLKERPVFVPSYGAVRQLTIPLHLRLLPAGIEPRRCMLACKNTTPARHMCKSCRATRPPRTRI